MKQGEQKNLKSTYDCSIRVNAFCITPLPLFQLEAQLVSSTTNASCKLDIATTGTTSGKIGSPQIRCPQGALAAVCPQFRFALHEAKSLGPKTVEDDE